MKTIKNFAWIAVFVFSSIALGWLIWKNYWKIESVINSDLLGPYTPSYFGFSGDESYQKSVCTGRSIALRSRLVICGLIRDRADRISEIKSRIDKISRYFGSVVVLVVENDSVDSTRQTLLEWSNESTRTKVEILGCGINSRECKMNLSATVGHQISSSRLEKMARLRNIYQQRVAESYADTDYVLVWDMDIKGSLYIDGILSSIARMKETNSDVMCANGVYVWPGFNLYYDTFAHSEEKLEWVEPFDKKIQDVVKGVFLPWSFSDVPRPVKTCFSGATLYKTKGFLSNEYTTNGQECEHNSKSKDLAAHVNPQWINYVMLND